MIARIPKGLRDILPVEAAERRQMESKLKKVFGQWGYGEVITPAFEYFDTLSSESGELIQREMFKLFDENGDVLALRPELTTPIARLVAQRLKAEEFPLRFYYNQSVFRDEPSRRGEQREFSQAGVELIGLKGPQADAEILVILINALKATGLTDFKIILGHIGFLKANLNEAGLSDRDQQYAIECLSRNDLVDYQNFLKKIPGRSARVIEQLPYLKGVGAIEKARGFSQSVETARELGCLSQIVEILKSQDLLDFIDVDLGVARNFDYYTGLVFDGFAEGLGFPFCGGGRYDNLLGEFNFPMPATGFQIGIERLQILLLKRRALQAKNPDKYLVCYKENVNRAFTVAEDLREKGNAAVIGEPCQIDESILESARPFFDWLVQVDSPEGIIGYNLSDGSIKKLGGK